MARRVMKTESLEFYTVRTKEIPSQTVRNSQDDSFSVTTGSV